MKIECKKNLFGRIFPLSCLIILMVAMAAGLWKPGIFGWIILIVLLFVSLVILPDLTLSDDGLEVSTILHKYWLTWNDVQQVRSNGLDTRFYATKLSFLHYLLNFSLRTGVFTITPFTHKNYPAAVTYLREKLGDKVRAW